MISVSLTRDGDGRLVPTYMQRRPDESLHDFLLRSRHEMSVHIRMLESVSDAQTELFASERTRWHRRMGLVVAGEAGLAATAYVALDAYGFAGTMAPPLVAATIGACALGGTAITMGIASLRTGVASWPLAAEDLVRRLLRRPYRVDEAPCACQMQNGASDGPIEGIAQAVLPAPDSVAGDFDDDAEIAAFIEERTIDRLESRTFLWGLRLLVFQAALITLTLCAVKTAFGVPLETVVFDAPPILGVSLICCLFLLGFSDLANSGLARLALWWRRR